MSFSDNTRMRASQRVDDLCVRFEECIAAFEAVGLFTGPSLYFHHKTLSIRTDLGCSVEACLQSENFFESLYATLASWGMHRMGPGNTKLVDFQVMMLGFQGQAMKLKDLERLAIHEVSPETVQQTADQIWDVIWNLPVGIGSIKIVSGSKALHHLLPDLVPPIDREYTVRFFLNHKNAIQGDEATQHEAFRLMYVHFASICSARKAEIESRLGCGMNTSITKVADNAIVGYGRAFLP